MDNLPEYELPPGNESEEEPKVEPSLVIPSSSAADSATPRSGYGIRFFPSPVLSLPRSTCISSPH